MRKILITEDDAVSRRMLNSALIREGYEIIQSEDGKEAWQILQTPEAPKLAILDWMMPGLDGVQLCRAIRERQPSKPLYLILLTGKGQQEDIVEGLEAGADDYMVKPCNTQELSARVKVGFRVLSLQESLAERVQELEQALERVKQLQGLLPICSYCKKIRDDSNYWHQVEEYVSTHAEVQFTHGICPACYQKEVIPQLNALKR